MAGAEDHSSAGEAARRADSPPEGSSSQQQQTAKRRRTGAPSSRGVANLTPEQLARKRANDREAQRAIRERTKNQIERLNRRIQELENQQPYHDLQLVVREKKAIQQENVNIKARLESVLAIIQTIVSPAGGLNELATAAERRSLPVDQQPPREALTDAQEPRPIQHIRNELASPQNGVASPAATDSSRQWLYPGDTTGHARRWSGDSPQFEQTPPTAPPVHAEMPFDGRMGVDFLLDDGQQRGGSNITSTSPPPTTSPGPSVGQYAPTLVPHLTLTRTIPSTCILDGIMLNFLTERRAEVANGVSLDVITGPPSPNFTPFVYRNRKVETHPLSKLFTDIISTFSDIGELPEQVAVVYVMFNVMRWQIAPTLENYERLPEWITPRASQLFVAHPYWMDHLPWPRLRDRVIAHQPFTPFEAFFVPYTKGLSLNWPHDHRTCLIRPGTTQHPTPPAQPLYPPVPPNSHVPLPPPRVMQVTADNMGTLSGAAPPPIDDEWVINPEFEAHVRDLRNWSLGPEFRVEYPHFAEAVTIKEKRAR